MKYHVDKSPMYELMNYHVDKSPVYDLIILKKGAGKNNIASKCYYA